MRFCALWLFYLTFKSSTSDIVFIILWCFDTATDDLLIPDSVTT